MLESSADSGAKTKAKGSYVLVLEILQEQRVTVGKLGEVYLSPGYYLYFGSALGGLEGRVRRHLRPNKKLHWHIDFLTAVAPVTEVWWAVDEERKECAWAAYALGRDGVTAPGPRFGSSDCRCKTHLVHVPTRDEVEDLKRRLITETGGGVYTPGTGDPDDRKIIS